MNTVTGISVATTRFGRAAIVVAVCAAALAIIIAATGGFAFAVAGQRVSLRSLPTPIVVLLVALLAAWRVSPIDKGQRDAWVWLTSTRRSGPVLAALVVLATLITGLAGTSWVAGGADASGYVAESELLGAGRLARIEPLARELRLPDAPSLVSPFGFRSDADAQESGRLVPTYAPGLPLLMAAASRLTGSLGPFLIVPITGAVAVWAVFALCRAFGHPGAGLAASVLLASHPSFLYQLVQPMSDVPVTAAWLLAAGAALQARAVPAGMATGLAVLIRPNLAPMAIPIAACLAAASASHTRHQRFRSLGVWALAGAPFIVIVALLHTIWYGAPWRSGYGAAESLFALPNIWPNIARYSRWLFESTGLFVLVLIAGALVAPRTKNGRTAGAWLAAAAAVNVLAYLPYSLFDEWHYVRFVLPAIALLLALGCTALEGWLGSFGRLTAASTMLVCLVVAAHAGWQLRAAASHDAFRLARLDRRYAMAASWIRWHTTPAAVIVTSQQSGNVALNAQRSVLRWDLLPAGSLDTAVAAARVAGRDVWLLLENWEQPDFLARHAGGSSLAALDWPPSAIVSADVQVRIYDTGARGRFLANEAVPTQYISDPRP